MDPPQNGSSSLDKEESSSSTMTRKRPRSNDDEAADDDESALAAATTTNQSSEDGNNATKIDGPNNKNTKNQSPSTSLTTEPKNDDDDVVVPPAQKQQQQPEQPTPITVEGTMPQKKFYRSRAHCNPLSHNDTFDYPTDGPESMDWTVEHYPNHPLLLRQNREPSSSSSSTGDGTSSKQETSSSASSVDKRQQEVIRPNVLDIGCGFGGLTVTLSTLLPQSTILGLEIRAKVTEYVRLRIVALRKENPQEYQNCSVMRTNTMKYLPHYFHPQSIDKMFFCFPDPHFKRKNHCRRIITTKLLTEYAFLLKKGTGKLYCITDVEELHIWHVEKCNAHPLFRKLSEEEMENDNCVEAMVKETEEGKKVERAGSKKYWAVYERIDEEKVETKEVHGGNFFDEGQLGVTIVTKTKEEEKANNEKKNKKGSETKGKKEV